MKELIQLFLDHMRADKAASENTILAYRGDLKHFWVDLTNTQGQEIGVESIDANMIAAYLNRIQQVFAPATVARRMASLHVFFEFLRSGGWIILNPAQELKATVVKLKPLPTLSVSQLEKLLTQVRSRRTPVFPQADRDIAMIELLYSTGLRITELVALNIGDVDTSERVLVCTSSESWVRQIPFREQAAVALDNYLKEPRTRLLRGRKETALFVNRRGERLSRQGFWINLKHYAENASIANVSAQVLRRTFAAHQLRTALERGPKTTWAL